MARIVEPHEQDSVVDVDWSELCSPSWRVKIDSQFLVLFVVSFMYTISWISLFGGVLCFV